MARCWPIVRGRFGAVIVGTCRPIADDEQQNESKAETASSHSTPSPWWHLLL